MSIFKTLRNASSYLALGSSVFVLLTSAALVGVSIGSSASAWAVGHQEKVYCDSENTIAFDWSFTNQEPNDPKYTIDLLVTEIHSGQTAERTVAPGETVSGSFDTDFTRVGSWRIRYESTWTNGMAGYHQVGDIEGAFECEQPPKHIEVCRDGKVITIPASERKDTDTNPPCPTPEYEYVCRDGKVIKIEKGTRRDGDTDAPCPVPEYEYVCRDGKVIKIEKGTRQDGDTDAPCPVPKYEYVCRDGEVVKINVEDRRDSDTDAPCPLPEFEYVCRDGEVIKINVNDRRDSDTDAPCPVTEYEFVCRDGEVVKIVTGERQTGDTDAPCPIPQEEYVCGDGEVVKINVEDRRDSDTDAPCPIPEEEYVCRDGKIVKIVVGERGEGDTDAPCPVPQVRGETTQKELPNTGSEMLLTGILGSILGLGMTAHYTARHLYIRQFN